jgi:hypothetical protein
MQMLGTRQSSGGRRPAPAGQDAFSQAVPEQQPQSNEGPPEDEIPF